MSEYGHGRMLQPTDAVDAKGQLVPLQKVIWKKKMNTGENRNIEKKEEV